MNHNHHHASQHALSLIDVLVPPVNPWLKGLTRSKLKLPAGVRIVRFSEEGDEDVLDVAEAEVASVASVAADTRHVSSRGRRPAPAHAVAADNARSS